MANAQISFGPKLGLLNNAAIGEIYYDQLRPLLRGIDALVQPNVLSASVTTPPDSPADGDAYVLLGTTSVLQAVTYTAQNVTPPNNFLSFTNTTSSGSLIFAYEANTAASPINSKLFGTQSMLALNGSFGWASTYLVNSNPDTTVSPFDNTPPVDPASNNPNWIIAEFPAAFNIFDQSLIFGGADWALIITNQPGSASLVVMTAFSSNEAAFSAAVGLPVGWTPLLYNFSSILIQGSVTSGVFVTGETVTQTGTGATAIVIDAPAISSAPMPVSGVTGTPSATATWTGGTSGAEYTPTTVPTPATNVAVFYKIVTTPNTTPVTIDWPEGIATGAQFTLSSFNSSPVEIPGALTSGGTVVVTSVSASNNSATITANNSFATGGGQKVSFNLTNATFLNGALFTISSATSTQFVVSNIAYNNLATITQVAISGDVATIMADNTFNPGDMVTISRLSYATFLNDQTFTIDTADSSSFTFSYSSADYGPTFDFGQAVVQITYSPTSEPSGATATVTFLFGETVYQNYSGAAAMVAGLSPTGAQLILSSSVALPNGYVDATDVWTGATSNAVFTPSSLPAPTPYQNVLSGTGAWAGKLNQLAVWSTQVTTPGSDLLAPAWEFYTPQAGWTAWVEDLGAYLSFDGIAWGISQGSYVQTNPTHSQEMNIPTGTSFTVTQKDGVGNANFNIVDDSSFNPGSFGTAVNVNTSGTNITANSTGVIFTANLGGIKGSAYEGGVYMNAYNTSWELAGGVFLNAYDSNFHSSSLSLAIDTYLYSNESLTIQAGEGGSGDVNISCASLSGVFITGYDGGVAIASTTTGGMALGAGDGGLAVSAGSNGMSIATGGTVYAGTASFGIAIGACAVSDATVATGLHGIAIATGTSGTTVTTGVQGIVIATGVAVTSPDNSIVFSALNSVGIYGGTGLSFGCTATPVTSTQTVTTTRSTYDASGGAIAANLPAANSVPAGTFFILKQIDSSGNIVTVTAAGSDMIDGNPTYLLNAQYKYVSLFSDGIGNWYIDGGN